MLFAQKSLQFFQPWKKPLVLKMLLQNRQQSLYSYMFIFCGKVKKKFLECMWTVLGAFIWALKKCWLWGCPQKMCLFVLFKHMVWTYVFAFVLYQYSHVTGRFLWEADWEFHAARLLDLLVGEGELGWAGEGEPQDNHSKGLSTPLGEFSSSDGLTESSCVKKRELSSTNSYKPILRV